MTTLSHAVSALTVREAIAVKEAQLNQKSLFEYSPKAGVTEDYSAFIDELLEDK
mgnify:CR=1 FL=1